MSGTTKTEPWIVQHFFGWCALPPGAEPDPDAWNDPTLCGYVVNMRGGSKHGTPTCTDCLTLLGKTSLVAAIKSTAAEGQDCKASHCPPGADGQCDWPRCAS